MVNVSILYWCFLTYSTWVLLSVFLSIWYLCSCLVLLWCTNTTFPAHVPRTYNKVYSDSDNPPQQQWRCCWSVLVCNVCVCVCVCVCVRESERDREVVAVCVRCCCCVGVGLRWFWEIRWAQVLCISADLHLFPPSAPPPPATDHKHLRASHPVHQHWWGAVNQNSFRPLK